MRHREAGICFVADAAKLFKRSTSSNLGGTTELNFRPLWMEVFYF